MEARKKTFNGIVVSDKMDKTIVVEVTNVREQYQEDQGP